MKKTIICLILLLFGTLCAGDANEVQETIVFLKNGEQRLKIDDNYRDLTLLIGDTRTGKSALTRYVAGNLADLKSVKVESSYFIQYKDESVIGNSTTVSQTIYPDLVIDELNNAFYDCPGFSDARNTSVEIAATYFMKKIVDHAQRLKFILVINYNDETTGASRHDFPRLVKHLSDFVKNVTNYRDSISLVATKAANASDDDIQHTVAGLLQEYRKEQLNITDKTEMSQYAVELLDILLTSKDNGKTFEKIGVFKKPTKEGPLNGISEMVEGRQNLREMILNRTAYSKKIDEDFGYTISDTAILRLVNIVTEINKGITEIVRNIGNELQKVLESETNNLENLIALTNQNRLAQSNLLAITENNTNLTPELVIDRIRNAAENMNISISSEYLNDISTQTNYIRFLQRFTSVQLAINPRDWARGLTDCITYLRNTRNWYTFLNELSTAYSQYEFLRDFGRYNLSSWNDLGKGVYIDSNNFRQFVQGQTFAWLAQNLEPTDIQLKMLNDLLNSILKRQPMALCDADGTKLVIKGDFIRTSDVNVTLCGDKLNQLYLLALHTVFIDSDLIVADKPIDIVIIGKNWYNLGDRKISIKGMDPIGNFMGLGVHFTNGDKLTINLNGGNGKIIELNGKSLIKFNFDVTSKPTIYNPSLGINEFGAFLRENLKNPFKRNDLLQFFELISNNAEILNSYSTKDFVNELQLLENQFYRLQNDADLPYYYRSFCNRIERFVSQLNANQTQLPREQLKVFNYLYASAWGKYVTLTTIDSNMIIDIERYLDASIQTIGNVKRSERLNIIGDHRKAYRQQIDAKISEASQFIYSDVLPSIARISNLLHKKLETLVKKRKFTEKRRERQELLRKQAGLYVLFDSLKMIGQVSSIMVSYATVANDVISGTTQIADGFIADRTFKRVPRIPERVRAAFNTYSGIYKKNIEDKIKSLNEKLENMIKIVEKNPNALIDFGLKINDLKTRLMDGIGNHLEKFIEISEELESTIAKQRTKIPDALKDILQSLRQAENFIKVMRSAFDLYKQIEGDSDTIEEVRQAIENNQANIDAFRRYERDVHSKLWPMIDEMRSTILDMEIGLAVGTAAVFSIKKWNIPSILQVTRIELARLTKGFDAQDDLLQTFQKLSEALTILITVYDRIDSYADQEKLGDYIACIASADVNSIPVSDPELQAAIDRLDVIITSNVLLTQYKLATDSYKHTVFPFITSYSDLIHLPSNLQLGEDTSDLVTVATSQLNNLFRRLAEYGQTVINGNDKFIYSTVFDPRIQSSSAFVEWHYDDNHQAICDLFIGKPISIWADIKRAPQMNAIKFNVVELLFRAPNAARQKQIDDLLANADITLTHMGNSYYRCGTEFYVIPSASQTILYSFEKYQGVPIRRNIVFNTILNGSVMLSPYAMWTVQLIPTKDPTLFNKLGQLADGVDLALIGRGQYADKRVPVCNNSMKSYYQVDEAIAVL